MNKSNLWGMLALVFGFMLAGCPADNEEMGTEQSTSPVEKTIEITGIPVSGETAQVEVFSGDLRNPEYAAKGSAVITDETLVVPLYDWSSEDERWRGDGELYIRLRLSGGKEGYSPYIGNRGKKYLIKDEVTTLAFEDFAMVFTTVEELTTFLTPLENTPGTPIKVKLVNLTEADWAAILAAIATAGKYVDLDVTDCQWGKMFDPGTANTGEQFITGLALPDTAESIVENIQGRNEDTFKYFSRLKTLSAAGLKTVNSLGFDMSYVSTTLNLVEVSLPAATTIGRSAFADSTSLTTVYLPATPPVIAKGKSYGIFYVPNEASNKITIVVPNAEAVAAYTTAWGVEAETAAGAKEDVYGNKHSAVTIEAAVQ
jgi:hypothetical protein